MSAVESANAGRPPPSRIGDQVFSGLVRACAVFVVILLIGIVVVLFSQALPSITRFGLNFFVTSDWDASKVADGCPALAEGAVATAACQPGQFGGFPYIIGTVITALIGLILATPLAVGAAIFISEYAPRRIGDLISFAIEMLVAIPSVVYGLWGVKILAPLMSNTVEPFLQDTLGRVPIIGNLFANPPNGNDYLTASLILTIMILPTILAISREVVRQVPKLQKEGMIALGATKWESIRLAVLPYARAGITGGAMLGLARAIGETLAVTMTIGNNPQFLGPSLFNSGYTLASGIANRVNESESIGYNALIELGLLLLLVSLIINMLSRVLVSRSVKM